MVFGVERWTTEEGTSIVKMLADPFLPERGLGLLAPSTTQPSGNPSR